LIMKLFMKTAIATAALAFAAQTHAAIIYNVNQTIGTGSVVGTVQTSGTIGALAVADFTAWNLELTGGAGPSFTITNLNSSVFIVGGNATATASNILFNYDTGANNYLLFQQIFLNGLTYWCNTSPGGAGCGGSVESVNALVSGSQQIAPRTGNLVIASVAIPGGVPEPANWALMLAGFGVVGAALRRRARVAVAFS
jgi:PEP-CTERM motif